jgi:hypothetical protein
MPCTGVHAKCAAPLRRAHLNADLRLRWLEEAGLKQIEISVVAREEEPPHFHTILASGVR